MSPHPYPRGLLAFLTGLWLCAAGAPAAPRDAFPLLAQAMRSKLTRAYVARQDVRIVSYGPQVGTTDIVADVARDRRRSRIAYRLPADVAGLVTVDDGARLCQYQPRGHLVRVSGSQTAEEAAGATPWMLSLLRHNYACARLRRETVNGRPCDVVRLCPRFYDGPSRLLWIDRSSRLILRTEEYDGDGRRVYVSCYETIRPATALPAAMFALPAPARAAARAAPVRPVRPVRDWNAAFAAAAVAGRLPAWRPRGYRLVRCALLTKATGRAAVLRYSDGLKTLSVIEETVTPALPTTARHQQMINQRLRPLGQRAWVRDGGGVRVTVLGDTTLPPALGREMLTSLDPRRQQQLRRGLARDFGASAAAPLASLRQAGWGYDEIAALLLFGRSHPAAVRRWRDALVRHWPWETLATMLHADVPALNAAARRWVARTLAR